MIHKPATEPNDLERFFIERANRGDVEGLLALYEPDATLACDDGTVMTGLDQIRRFFTEYLADRPRLALGTQALALRSGNLALTSARSANGDVSVEIARCQSDGTWLWVVDQFALVKRS